MLVCLLVCLFVCLLVCLLVCLFGGYFRIGIAEKIMIMIKTLLGADLIPTREYANVRECNPVPTENDLKFLAQVAIFNLNPGPYKFCFARAF